MSELCLSPGWIKILIQTQISEVQNFKWLYLPNGTKCCLAPTGCCLEMKVNSSCKVLRDPQGLNHQVPEFQNSPSSQISEFEKFPKFFQNFKNGAGPKNRLVHPELWVGHFWRFLDLAIFWKNSKFAPTSLLTFERQSPRRLAGLARGAN